MTFLSKKHKQLSKSGASSRSMLNICKEAESQNLYFSSPKASYFLWKVNQNIAAAIILLAVLASITDSVYRYGCGCGAILMSRLQ